MSLSPAVKEISNRPSKDAVTEPVNKEKLRTDLDRKLKLYGVFQALRLGKLPSNAQIDESLRYIETHSPVDLSSLSPSGRQLIEDLRRIIGTARALVQEKNDDELLQQFLWHTRSVQRPAKGDPSAATSLSADKVKDDSLQAAHHLRTLLSLLITNSEARKLISDFSLIGRDLFARSADLVRPNEDALRRVDETVPTDQPTFQGKNRETGTSLAEEELLRQKMHDVRQGSGQAFNAMAGSAMGLAQKGRHNATLNDRGAMTNDQAQNASPGGANLKEKVPEKQRNQITTQYDRARKFLWRDYFPQERRERLIYRLKKVIIECQNERDYQDSLRWFLDLISQYTGEGVTVATDTRPRVDWEQGPLKQARDELFALLTRIANNHSPQPTMEAGRKLYDISRQDPELREWLNSINIWLRKILLEPGYVLNEECDQEGRSLRENGRKFFDEKYKTHFDSLFNEIGDWLRDVIDDPLNGRLMRDWTHLIRDLFFNSEGALSWKPELWADIRSVILPQIIDKAGYIPIPRAEFSNQTLDLVIENLAISGKNMFPNVVAIEAHNYFKFSPFAAISDRTQHNLTITLSQIQTDLRDVMFYFNKKTGFPKVKDSGIADVLIGGNGITTTIHLLGAEKDPESLFYVQNVNVKVDQLKFSIRDSKHDALYKYLRPLATGIVKKQVQRAIRDGIISALTLVNQQLVRLRDKMNEEGSTRTQVLRDMFKQQTKDVRTNQQQVPQPREKHFNIMPKRDSLLLPDEGNPNGWICRQDFEDKIASEGDEWRSPAFSFVSPPSVAHESSMQV